VARRGFSAAALSRRSGFSMACWMAGREEERLNSCRYCLKLRGHTLRQASMFLIGAEHVQRLAPLRATVRQPPRVSPRNAGAMTAFLKKSSFSIGRASA
jgi:hypothetical protein